MTHIAIKIDKNNVSLDIINKLISNKTGKARITSEITSAPKTDFRVLLIVTS